MTIKLPTKPTPPMQRLEDYIIFLYGPPKIGKTTWASQMDRPLFLATESGLRAIAAFQIPISSWSDFLKAAALIATDGHDFRTIVIDTVDNLYAYCAHHIYRQHGIHHESDLEWGKGWALVRGEFMRALNKLALLPYGLVMISHSEDREIKSRTHTVTRTVPTLPRGARAVAVNMADIILYADLDTTGDEPRRVVRTQPSDRYEAGMRTGRLPDPLPLDFAAFKKHFKSPTTPTGLTPTTEPVKKGA